VNAIRDLKGNDRAQIVAAGEARHTGWPSPICGGGLRSGRPFIALPCSSQAGRDAQHKLAQQSGHNVGTSQSCCRRQCDGRADREAPRPEAFQRATRAHGHEAQGLLKRNTFAGV